MRAWDKLQLLLLVSPQKVTKEQKVLQYDWSLKQGLLALAIEDSLSMTHRKLLRYGLNFREDVYVHMCVHICTHVCMHVCACALCVCICGVCASVCMHEHTCIPMFRGCWKQRSYQSLRRNSNQFSSNCSAFLSPQGICQKLASCLWCW